MSQRLRVQASPGGSQELLYIKAPPKLDTDNSAILPLDMKAIHVFVEKSKI